MPVIICADKKEPWLSDDTGNPAALKSLLVPYPEAEMEMHPI
jgi:putative SOS response-associated peptidase YedK